MTKKSITKADLQEQLTKLNEELVPDNVRIPRRLATRVQELRADTGMKKQDIYTAALEQYFESIDEGKKASKQ